MDVLRPSHWREGHQVGPVVEPIPGAEGHVEVPIDHVPHHPAPVSAFLGSEAPVVVRFLVGAFFQPVRMAVKFYQSEEVRKYS